MDRQVLDEITADLREEFRRAKEETQSENIKLMKTEIEDEDGYELTVTYKVRFPHNVSTPTRKQEIDNMEYNLQCNTFDSVFVEEW